MKHIVSEECPFYFLLLCTFPVYTWHYSLIRQLNDKKLNEAMVAFFTENSV